jgi:hypothetical protein
MHNDIATNAHPNLYGLSAEFNTPEELVSAAQKTRMQGYYCFDAYSPFPVHGMDEAMGLGNTYVPLLVLIGGVTGALTGFGMQYISMAVHYPYISGGKPFVSWPQFIPITFEMGILFAAFAAVFGMLGLNRLPRPHHPIFNAKRSARISSDGFFLCVEAVDPRFDVNETRAFLDSLHPVEVAEVPFEEPRATVAHT